MMAPADTVSPAVAVRPVMVPDRCAVRGCSIFMASRTTTRSHSDTTSPCETATFTMVPCMGEVRALPVAAAGPAERERFLDLPGLPAAAEAVPGVPRDAGRTT